MLQNTYAMINNRLFNGELPECHIYVSSACKWENIECHGMCMFDETEYFILISLDQTPFEFFNTLVHEMIHIWMRENGFNFWAHNRTFKMWTLRAMEEFYE